MVTKRMDLPTLIDRFHEQHNRRYGHDSVQRNVEAITLRLRARLASHCPINSCPSIQLDPTIAAAIATASQGAVISNGAMPDR